MGPVVQIPPIGSRILGNEDDFLNSLINKPPGLFENRSNPSAPVRPPDLWNRAEGAEIGTAFRDLEISVERWGGENSGCLFVVEKSGLGKEVLGLLVL